MSVVVCRSSAAPFQLEKEGLGSMIVPTRERPPSAPLASISTNICWAPAQQQNTCDSTQEMSKKDAERPEQLDIWSMIQSQKAIAGSAAETPSAPYVHPLMRRSSSLMSEKSLEMCTESLGSESGSADFSSLFSDDDTEEEVAEEEEEEEEEIEEIQEKTLQAARGEQLLVGSGRRELSSVNYHCSVNRRSPPRSFPPPLSSISRRDGPCLHMRPHRRDGRLVMEAVPVHSQKYLHARREDGRLLLSIVDASVSHPCTEAESSEMPPEQTQDLKEEQETEAPTRQQVEEEEEEEEELEVDIEDDDDDDEAELEEEEEEEEVEVVDRGTVVEVKVSTQPQQQSGAMKVHRSSLVINKFVGGAPAGRPALPDNHRLAAAPPSPPRRLPTTPTTAAAAAAVAASSVSASSEMVGQRPPSSDNKLLFTSKRRNREELLHHMRRCSELRRPLFFFEPYCIATSS